MALKKIVIIILAVLFLLILGAAYFVFYRLSKEDLFGWRLNFALDKVETNDYYGFAPNIAFRYSKIFELDHDPEKKKYGKSYLVGMKLKTDDRTGCDIRTGGPELDFKKSANELAQEIVGPIAEKASDLRVIEKQKTKIGGQDGFKVSFSFLDPIGARIRLDQVFTRGKNGENFMIICGAGEYQFNFFEKDFRVFYDSISFDGKLETPKKWWQEALDLIKIGKK